MLRLTEKDATIGLDPTLWFDVTVTETLEQIVRVEACNPEEAEKIVAKDWQKGEFVLDSENFTCVEFVAIPVEDKQYSAAIGEDADSHTVPSSTGDDYSPASPWDAPGMDASDFV